MNSPKLPVDPAAESCDPPPPAPLVPAAGGGAAWTGSGGAAARSPRYSSRDSIRGTNSRTNCSLPSTSNSRPATLIRRRVRSVMSPLRQVPATAALGARSRGRKAER
jgi:hypothetical protein